VIEHESGFLTPTGSGLAVPSALKLTCTLPDAMAQICDEVIEGVGQE
jgi:hypothetical protein